MIAHLTGVVLSVHESHVVLDVRGVGYKVYVTQQTLGTLTGAESISLHTHLAVREDAMDLYGFLDHTELALFKHLIGVSGIGPRSALGILGLDTIEKLTAAIAAGDVGYLTKVSGVGKKSAEKIVLELREKVAAFVHTTAGPVDRTDTDALEALEALGYRREEARDALRSLASDITDPAAKVKAALQALMRT